MYDIIYSINVHESPECVYDLIKNIRAYHQTLTVGIILHTNKNLFEVLQPSKDVWIYPQPLDKEWCSYGIFLGYIQNFLYLHSKNIEAKYYILLASNCMFHRPVSLELIQNKYAESEDVYIPTAPMPPIAEWAPIYQLSCNADFFNFFHELGIPFINSYHEGSIYPWEIFHKIATLKDWNTMRSKITLEFSFEEVLFPSLHKYFTNKGLRSICTMKLITLESIHEIKNPCIKSIQREYNTPIRQWLRKDTDLYFNSK